MCIRDRVETVSYDEAKFYTNLLSKKFGVLTGISGGANVSVAVKLANELGIKRRVVTVLPDTGERYLSTDLFD
jgi:cysteine synthase A